MAGKRLPYSTNPKWPSKKVERRIKMPQPPKRPLRFQARSIIRHELIRGDAWWFTMHRRGPKRPEVGENQLEARAIPQGQIRGTLPERIIYRALIEQYHFVPNVDFDFQSSLQGGRMETGGIVADFLFPILMIVINPLGPTHDEFLRIAKDTEQILALNELGYQVYMIPEQDVYNEETFNEIMKKIFNLYHGGGAESSNNFEPVPDVYGFQLQQIYQLALEIRNEL